MNNEQLKAMPEKQLQLLAKRSEEAEFDDDVCALTHAMTEIVPLIQSLSYQGRHMSQQKMLHGN